MKQLFENVLKAGISEDMKAHQHGRTSASNNKLEVTEEETLPLHSMKQQPNRTSVLTHDFYGHTR